MSESLTLRGRPRRRHWWREFVTSTYRDARDAWEALRESDSPAYNAAGAANSGVVCYQLEDDEFRQMYPPPTFKAVLLEYAGQGQRAHTWAA